ncbi:PepSY-like domain-containing protein [Flavobacterium agrisoli]|uniref:PepSY-like domain-containing protein n=1 Tax=Flavobacterium agrisoli TaxID=2793066 RepID=A0A934UKI0_9FLAO|nr:PepSY-like domain-containing protein [Flavobacterium agrisoli]MBK0371116.1 PepSY-like domain-containing protein [Flavobacterium agrisoli]
MKRLILLSALSLYFLSNALYAQDVPQSQVPSVVVNVFQQNFQKAYDIEWEMDGDRYKIAFETGILGNDHEAWYTSTGKLVKHVEEISKSDLPASVLKNIQTTYNGYQIDDIEKITEGLTVTYKMELESFTQDWKIVCNSNGKTIRKIAD